MTNLFLIISARLNFIIYAIGIWNDSYKTINVKIGDTDEKHWKFLLVL